MSLVTNPHDLRKAIEAGGVVRVGPGEYHLADVPIRHRTRIVGEGRPVLYCDPRESPYSQVLFDVAVRGALRLEGIDLRTTTRTTGGSGIVNLTRGSLLAEDCRFYFEGRLDHSFGVRIAGPTRTVSLDGCTVVGPTFSVFVEADMPDLQIRNSTFACDSSGRKAAIVVSNNGTTLHGTLVDSFLLGIPALYIEGDLSPASTFRVGRVWRYGTGASDGPVPDGEAMLI